MINRVVLAGRLTRDVEVRKTNTGLSVASFTVAIDRRGARQDGQQQTADFINCVAWRQSADFLGQYAGKGAMIGVDGRLQTRSYDRNDGTKAYVTEVVCDNVSILESKATSQNRMMNQNNGAYNNNNYGNSYGNNNGFNNNGFGGYDNGYQQPGYQEPMMQSSNNVSSNDNNDFGNAGLDISSDDLPF